MAIRTVVTRGFGNGTFNGTIATVVRRGYQSAAVVAISELPSWQRVEANRFKYNPKLQTVPEFNKWPESPALETSGDYTVSRGRGWSVKLPWNDPRDKPRQETRPELSAALLITAPVGPTAPLYPSFVPPESIKTSFDIKLQVLPDRNQEVGIATPEPGVYPTWLPPARTRFSFTINNQLVELDQFTATPAATSPSDILTGWLRPEANKFSFDLSRVPHNESFNAPIQPPITGPGVRLSAPEEFRISFKRRHLTVPDLLERPATVAPAPEDWPVSNGRPKQFKINFERVHLTPQELNTYPATPAAYYEGHYPGSALAKSLKVSRKVKLQSSPELNVYPLKSSAGDWPSFERPKTFKIGFSRKHLTKPEHNEYPQTSEAFRAGYYPGSKQVEGFKTAFNIKVQLKPEHNTHPLAPSAASLPALIQSGFFKAEHKRRVVVTPELDQYPPFVVPPVPTRRICFTEHEHRVEIEPGESRYELTPRNRRKL